MAEFSSNESPLIFALDTSSAYTSLGLARGEAILAGLLVQSTAARSERIWRQTEILFQEAGVTMADMNLVAVCSGPGGFTGIRVGVAAGKGLARAAGLPLIGVSALEAVASSAASALTGADITVCALIRAYRDDTYWQLFKIDANRRITELSEPQISSLAEMLGKISGIDELTLVGQPACEKIDVIRDYMTGVNPGRARVLAPPKLEMDNSGEQGSPVVIAARWRVCAQPVLLAADVAKLAFRKYLLGEAQDPGDVRATYIRPSEAEIKLSLGLVGPGLRGKLAEPDVAK
ncbi:MAG TPA: tRNA (adenosine(37)-N6)-threonylcarbamoyltransferase complex dimerization subunit type 1 TsaB [Blastocatellia bacterium]